MGGQASLLAFMLILDGNGGREPERRALPVPRAVGEPNGMG